MRLTGIVTIMLVLSGCNLQQGVKEAGDAIETGAENIVEGVKQTPRAIGDAANKLDKSINE